MKTVERLIDIADQFDAIVLDQWGVLHDGSAPYPLAVKDLKTLKSAGTRLAVLSNSGKRSAPNTARIAAMGFDADLFDTVMTSGEALWQDIDQDRVLHRNLFPITRETGDAESWADGLDVVLVDRLEDADAVLLMGLPDGVNADAFDHILNAARTLNIPVLCTNPDRASPRAGGAVVTSPGALAHAYKDAGGTVQFYGKPHAPVFRAVETALGLPPSRLLMVGDSLEHDIAGGHGAGWSTVFVRGGLHASAFHGDDAHTTTLDLAQAENTPLPTFTLYQLG